MQLIIISISLFLLISVQQVKAQVQKVSSNKSSQNDEEQTEIKKDEYVRPDWQKIDINFLSSYYEQDGNNAAVTGGIGTEQLTDFTQKISVNLPLSKSFRLNVDGGYDYYSSASTDAINSVESSASSADVRSHLNVGFAKKLNDYNSWNGRVGFSTEYDYQSLNIGAGYGWLSKSENTGININAQAFIDKWSLIYPVELRRTADAGRDDRQSYNLGLTINQVINPKVQMSFMTEATYMNGLLSTPFHRVYLSSRDQAVIEKLPSTRLKIPLATRVNAYLSEKFILRTYYRYYWDNWGIQGHTASVEIPFKVNRFFAITPHYRYHTQTAADYFAPYQQNEVSQEFYTSDYDLSALDSHSYGVGLTYSPASPIWKTKIPFKRQFTLDGIDVKYSHYDRSTGLSSNIISLGIKMGL